MIHVMEKNLSVEIDVEMTLMIELTKILKQYSTAIVFHMLKKINIENANQTHRKYIFEKHQTDHVETETMSPVLL